MESTGQMCDTGTSQQRVLLSSAEVPTSCTRCVESVQSAQDFPLTGTALYSCGYCGWGLARPTDVPTISRLANRVLEKVRCAPAGLVPSQLRAVENPNTSHT